MSPATELLLPTPQQLAFQDWEFGMFCHFGLYTYVKEQPTGTGYAPSPEAVPEAFQPTELDPEQWVAAALKAGMNYLVLTCKHHEGFCLWPTATTEHSVKNSSWRGGQGDVVREVADACHRAGLEFGTYLSPWDYHCPFWSDEAAYDDFYVAQLTELLTGYGEIAVVWFDGCGSANHRYDGARVMQTICAYQPEAHVFGIIGEPTYRWVGNEQGLAPYPCWNVAQLQPSLSYVEGLASQSRWWPAECDVPIRRDWGWQPDNINTLKTYEELLDIYYRSVGHGSNLLLNLAPNRRGLLDEEDVVRLHEMSGEIHSRFAKPLATAQGNSTELSLSLPGPTALNHAVLQEDLSGGERVRAWVLEVQTQGNWQGVYEGSAIGHKHIATFPEVTGNAVRLRITDAAGEPVVRSLSVYRVSGFVPAPTAYAPMDI